MKGQENQVQKHLSLTVQPAHVWPLMCTVKICSISVYSINDNNIIN